MRISRKLALVLGAAIVIALVPWALSFADPAPEQDNCSFNSVSNADYRELLSQAKAQGWTVWPGLSNGIFWPSDRGPLSPSLRFENPVRPDFLEKFRPSIPREASPDVQLAAAHAAMRSIGAEYVRVSNVPDFPKDGKIISKKVGFWYFFPQRRFAPLCIHCFGWPTSTLTITFHHDLKANTYALDSAVIMYANPLYTPRKEQDTASACPAFPEEKKTSRRLT